MNEFNSESYQSGTVIFNHPNSSYHQAPGLSASQVKTFALQSPKHFQYLHLQNHYVPKQSESMKLGSAVHCAVLEPYRFENDYQTELQADSIDGLLDTVVDLRHYCEQHGLSKTGVKQELIARVLAFDQTAPVLSVLQQRHRENKKITLTQTMMDTVLYMRDSVLNNSSASELFSEGDSELSIWSDHQDTGMLIKCRPDYLRKEGICVDLKTCHCASPYSFTKDIIYYGYDIQAAHYIEVLNGIHQTCERFFFVAVESEPPYVCQVYELDSTDFIYSINRYQQIMNSIYYCIHNDDFPSYADQYSILNLPVWYIKQLEKYNES